MTRNARRVHRLLFALLLGVVPLTTCAVSLPPPGETGAATQAWVDTLQTFIEDFARQLLQAALL